MKKLKFLLLISMIAFSVALSSPVHPPGLNKIETISKTTLQEPCIIMQVSAIENISPAPLVKIRSHGYEKGVTLATRLKDKRVSHLPDKLYVSV